MIPISCVYNFAFKLPIESKIGEANTQIIIFGWCEYNPHGYFI